jgi:hypothetical protein
MHYEVELDVPLVSPRRPRLKYPFHQMQKGDSFSLPAADKARSRASTC